MHRFLTRFRSPFVWVPLLCGLVYCIFIRPDQANYFRELAHAFLDGKLYLEHPSQTHDLVFFRNRYYLYWPPVPALVWLPLVALLGDLPPDGLVGAVAGILNVALVMKLLRVVSERYGLALSAKTIAWAGIFWGLGTAQFHLAPRGNTWYFAQTIAQTFLLGGLLLAFRNRSWFWSGVLFALAVYCRNNLVFAGLFFALVYLAQNRPLRWAQFFRNGGLFILPFLVLSGLNLLYNHARFGNWWENGIQYHLMDPYFYHNFKTYGYFSTHYLSYNFWVEVLHPPTLIPEVPFIRPEPEGFGFLWASPVFFLLFPALATWIGLLISRKPHLAFKLITWACWITALPIAMAIFMIMGTGWQQHGARYTFDFHIFLVLFLAFLWPQLRRVRWMPALGVVLVVLSILVQVTGIP
ncbi:MAG: hypothetical protein EOP52_02990 [Sphingobacteriales bacterium]|nr:MAG: hypothetical protein EOP52_02990 [Sphingobacteriales bacterium]